MYFDVKCQYFFNANLTTDILECFASGLSCLWLSTRNWKSRLGLVSKLSLRLPLLFIVLQLFGDPKQIVFLFSSIVRVKQKLFFLLLSIHKRATEAQERKCALF